MQRWEYRVVALQVGRYTDALNEYGREGWELVNVAADPGSVPAAGEAGSRIPVPRTLGRLEDAASKLNRLGTTEAPEAASTSGLLWVLRRALPDDD